MSRHASSGMLEPVSMPRAGPRRRTASANASRYSHCRFGPATSEPFVNCHPARKRKAVNTLSWRGEVFARAGRSRRGQESRKAFRAGIVRVFENSTLRPTATSFRPNGSTPARRQIRGPAPSGAVPPPHRDRRRNAEKRRDCAQEAPTVARGRSIS